VAVRVKVRLRVREHEVTTSALVNTGFETEKPQVLIPLGLARKLKLWPPPVDSYPVELGTAGGVVREYVVPSSIEVSVVTNDRVVGPITSDALISHMEEEVIINDKLTEALGIVILAAGTGKWRFIDEDNTRSSESPMLW
jgi:hypothetical protein